VYTYDIVSRALLAARTLQVPVELGGTPRRQTREGKEAGEKRKRISAAVPPNDRRKKEEGREKRKRR
jgi:hypothetical protein